LVKDKDLYVGVSWRAEATPALVILRKSNMMASSRSFKFLKSGKGLIVNVIITSEISFAELEQ